MERDHRVECEAVIDASSGRVRIRMLSDKAGEIAYVEAVPATETIYRIEDVTVDPDFRKRGMGAAALNRLEIVMRERFVTGLELIALEDVVEFYKKCGYKDVFHFNDGFVLMVKELG